MKIPSLRSSAPSWILLACGLVGCASVREDPVRVPAAAVATSAEAAEQDAVESAQQDRAADVVRIPFTLTAADNISVRAVLNGADAVDLMFHTAVDSVSMTKAAIAKLSGFKAEESVNVQSWGGTTAARHSTGNTLQIGGLVFRDVAVTEDENSGAGTAGKFGPSLFAGRIVDVDFDARELVIHAWLPAKAEGYQRLDFISRHGAMSVLGEVSVGERRLTTEFMLHTGFGGTALLDEEFVRTHELDAELKPYGASVLKDSYGNDVKTSKVLLPGLRFGGTTFANVPVGLFPGKIGSRRTSVVGAGLLKRLNFIIDAEHRRFYVAPNALMGSPFATAGRLPRKAIAHATNHATMPMTTCTTAGAKVKNVNTRRNPASTGISPFVISAICVS